MKYFVKIIVITYLIFGISNVFADDKIIAYFDMTEVLAVLLKHLDIRYHSIGSLDIVTEWKHLLDTIGQDIQITSKISNQVYNGNAIDVGKNGDLIVKLKDGSIREFPSGEITLQQ